MGVSSVCYRKDVWSVVYFSHFWVLSPDWKSEDPGNSIHCASPLQVRTEMEMQDENWDKVTFKS